MTEASPGRTLVQAARRCLVGAPLLAACGLATAPPAAAQSVGAVTNLSFGSFVAGSGGTVTVTPLGARSQSGGVVILGQGAGVAPAQITVIGTANATYSISLPANNTVVLTDANSNTMSVSAFTSSPAGTGTLSGGGSQVVRVGATLSVGNRQAPGIYGGSFSVIVNY